MELLDLVERGGGVGAFISLRRGGDNVKAVAMGAKGIVVVFPNPGMSLERPDIDDSE